MARSTRLRPPRRLRALDPPPVIRASRSDRPAASSTATRTLGDGNVSPRAPPDAGVRSISISQSSPTKIAGPLTCPTAPNGYLDLRETASLALSARRVLNASRGRRVCDSKREPPGRVGARGDANPLTFRRSIRHIEELTAEQLWLRSRALRDEIAERR